MRFFIFLVFCSANLIAQNNWYLQHSTANNTTKTDTVYRVGSVAISHAFKSPFNSRLMVTGFYGSENARGQYISLNEPRMDLVASPFIPLSTSTVGLATSPNANYQGLTINNYANFESGTTFTDVHNASLEVNYKRGFPDSLGFRDGGRLNRAATARFSGSFSNNNRAYVTDDFDLINLRLFTDADAGNLASVENFYALRMEEIRGVNSNIITNGWGVYIQPSLLKNHFGGFVGIGTTAVTNALTVMAVTNPVKFIGLQNGSETNKILTIDNEGVIKKNSINEITRTFNNTTSNTILTDSYEIYIHEGGNVVYTLPPANTRTGKVWKIVNIGSGTITTSLPFYEGDATRNTILNKAGASSYSLFSDGTKYISF